MKLGNLLSRLNFIFREYVLVIYIYAMSFMLILLFVVLFLVVQEFLVREYYLILCCCGSLWSVYYMRTQKKTTHMYQITKEGQKVSCGIPDRNTDIELYNTEHTHIHALWVLFFGHTDCLHQASRLKFSHWLLSVFRMF